jgi:hypothetical protein
MSLCNNELKNLKNEQIFGQPGGRKFEKLRYRFHVGLVKRYIVPEFGKSARDTFHILRFA